MSKKVGRWTAEIYQIMAKQRQATVLDGDALTEKRLWELPSFDVYQILLDKSREDYELLMSGNDVTAALQLSQIKWLDAMLSFKLGAAPLKFEDWFEEWSAGYPSLRYRTNPKLPTLKTQHPPNDVRDSDGNTIEKWRGDASKRPAYIEWKVSPQKDAAEAGLWRTIEYFKARDAEKSYLLTGTDLELIRQILQIEYEGGGVGGGESEPPPSEISYRGVPRVILYFREKAEDVEEGYRTMEAEIGFRLVGKSEDPAAPGDTLTRNDIRALAQRLQQNFLVPVPFKFKKGKDSVSYRDKKAGLESFSHFFSVTEGVEFYRKLCAAIPITFDDSKVFSNVNQNPAKAFPTVPEEVTVLNTKVRRPRRRPVGDVHFKSAKLFLELWDKAIVLCDDKGEIFTDANSAPEP